MMKRLLFATMALCLGIMAGSCSKDNNTGNDESDDASPFVGTWAILDEAGQKAVGIEIIGNDMTLRRYNAIDINGYGFSDGVVSASLDDFESDGYVYDVADDGYVTIGGIDAGVKLSLSSDDVLTIESDGTETEAYRVSEFAGKPEPSIIGTWDVDRYYLRDSDGSIDEESVSPGEGEYFAFTESEMSLCFPGENPEIYTYTLDGDIISLVDIEGYTSQYQIIELTETTMNLYVDYGGETLSGWVYELKRRQ